MSRKPPTSTAPTNPPSTYSYFSSRNVAENEEIAEVVLVIPPDSGYGWVVTLSAFIVSCMSDGGMYTFGIFIDDISKSFGVRPTKVAIASSLLTGFNFSLGPVCCALVNRYGFRIISIIGGVILAAAFAGASFLNNIEAFLVAIGFFGGAGSCLFYTPAIIVVGFYFEKWRALATAITACGSSVGIIIFPIVFTTLFEDLSWRTKFQIIAGCYLFCCLLCLTFKPIAPVKLDENKRAQIANNFSTATIKGFDTARGSTYRSNRHFPTVSQATLRGAPGKAASKKEEDPQMIGLIRGYLSTVTLGRGSTYSSRYTSYEDYDGNANCCKRCRIRCCMWCCMNLCCCCEYCRTDEIVSRPMYRDDVFYAFHVYRLPKYADRKAISAGAEDKKAVSIGYHMSVTRLTTLADLEEQKMCLCCPQAVRRTVATMMDFRFMKLASFNIMLLSGVFTVLGLLPPFVFIIDKATAMGIEHDDAAFLVSVIGIANAVGRGVCGVVSFFPSINVTYLIAVSLVLCGISLALSNFLITYVGQIVCAALFGCNIAVYFALRTIMMVDLYGLENLTNCFGLNLLFQGLISFAGVPLASMLAVNTGSYDASYYMVGCCMVISGVLLIPVPHMVKREKANKKIPTGH